MASSVVTSFQPRSAFLGDRNVFKVSNTPYAQVGYSRKTIECKESRIGKQPIAVPTNVTIALEGQDLKVKGPLGELALTYPREVELIKEDAGVLRVKKTVETRRANQMHGLFRTLTDNMVVGVSKGFEKKLILVGVGYRATVEGKELVLNLGFSHPVKMQIPESLKVKVEENTRITVSGYDKSEIGQFAATVRKWRPPEPYKGKGVKYSDEIVRRKEGKAGSADFPQLKPEEIKGITTDFEEPGFLAPTGLFLGGAKYMVIQGEPGAVIRGKKGPGGVTIKKTTQALVIGIYEEPMTGGQCNLVVERLGDYLIESDL